MTERNVNKATKPEKSLLRMDYNRVTKAGVRCETGISGGWLVTVNMLSGVIAPTEVSRKSASPMSMTNVLTETRMIPQVCLLEVDTTLKGISSAKLFNFAINCLPSTFSILHFFSGFV
jgi:hypothetical protein